MAADPIAAIRLLDGAFTAGIATQDLDALVDATYADDAELLPPHRPSISGRAGIAGYWRGELAGGLRGITSNTTRVETAADMAFAIGQYAARTGPPTAHTRFDKGKYLLVLRCRPDGRWQVVAAMFGSDGPQAQRALPSALRAG